VTSIKPTASPVPAAVRRHAAGPVRHRCRPAARHAPQTARDRHLPRRGNRCTCHPPRARRRHGPKPRTPHVPAGCGGRA
jgi:hypothetical protein